MAVFLSTETSLKSRIRENMTCHWCSWRLPCVALCFCLPSCLLGTLARGWDGMQNLCCMFDQSCVWTASLLIAGLAELSHSLKVSDRRRNTPKSAQNRSESLCADLWYCAGYFGFGVAQLQTQIRLEIEDFWTEPSKFSGPV